MLFQRLKRLLKDFRKDTHGSIMVETVIALPMLFWATAATYEFHEVHRYQSAREKATYTIADMISREEFAITSNYLDRTLTVFDDMTNDEGENQIRVSVVEYDEDTQKYHVSWSHTRGTGTLEDLDDTSINEQTDRLPELIEGQQIILVEAVSVYTPSFKVGLGDALNVETRIFTAPRLVPKVDYK
ncbi:pilus assembly protein [Roseovarius sp. A21]|uniref:Pilus assembly protein n=1 Tax=Roseovarius bejariae TaxID=2576383 RepID=A0A844D589_9RHOB|nr:pilus assembly protein [Roseovarius bejariae]MRU16468.1 pilus assembly protein [Roseovarius bejariae]